MFVQMARVLLPARLWYDLIWRPSRAVDAAPAQVVALLVLCGLPLALGLILGGVAGGWLIGASAACIVAGLAMEGLVGEGAALLLIGGLVAITRPPRLVAGIQTTLLVPDGARLAAAMAAASLILALTVGLALLVGRLPWRWPASLVAAAGGSGAALLTLIVVEVEPSLIALALIGYLITLLPLVLGAVGCILISVPFLACILAVFGAVAVESRALTPFTLLAGLLCATHAHLPLVWLITRSAGSSPSERQLGALRRATAPPIALLMVVSAIVGGLLAAGISVLPTPLFLLVCWFAGVVGIGYYERDWANLLVVLLVPLIGIETQGLAVTGAGLLVALLGAYRLFPEYPCFAAISILGTREAAGPAERWLYRLPPWSSEHLWLPLPGHGRLLRKALGAGAPMAFDTVEQMQALAQAGFTRTLLAALPPLVYANLGRVQDPPSIAAWAGGQSGLLLDTLVQLGARHAWRVRTVAPPTRMRLRRAVAFPWERRRRRWMPLIVELTVVLPGLYRVAQLTAAALDASGFERTSMRSPDCAHTDLALDDEPPRTTLVDARDALEQLASELATVDAEVAQRWQPVMNCWREALGASSAAAHIP